MDHTDIEKIFSPDSVVICGVSDGPANLGREIVKNLNRFAYPGRVYGLGRIAMEIEGRRVYADLKDLPEIPELAVILVPAGAVVGLLDACGRVGIRRVVIETGGFSEFGAERKGMEDEIRRVAAERDMTCMGPNCIGVINMETGLCLPFVGFSPAEIVKGANSFVSQSGGLVHELTRRCLAENVGVSKLTSIGNKLMADENDILDFLIRDPETGVIGIYLEDVKNGRRLIDLASSTEKPVIVLKGNTSPMSMEVASFHTAALLGDEGVLQAALQQAGIQRVASLREMVDCFKIFSLPPMKGPNLVVMSRSGGQAVTLADEAYRQGFTLPALPPAFAGRIREEAKAGVIRNTNPLDLGDVFNDLFYLEVAEMALKEPTVDGLLFFYDYPFDKPGAFDIIAGVERLSHAYEKPVVLCMVPDRTDWFALKYFSSFPWFSEPEHAVSALRRSLAHYRKKTEAPAKRVAALPVEGALSPDNERSELSGEARRAVPGEGALSPNNCIASTAETLSLMRAYGVPVVRHELVRNRAEGIEAAHRIGYPVVLKSAEPFILHKTEAGAVRLRIGCDEELGKAFDAVEAEVYLLQAMACDGVETIIGAKRDPEFGPVIMFGLGGIFVEVLKDVTVRVAPIEEADARAMIGEIKGAALLAGARGTKPADREALVRTLVGVSKLLVDHAEILSLDINPFRVFAEGEGGAALDVKIECSAVHISP
jgi:acetyltransferase